MDENPYRFLEVFLNYVYFLPRGEENSLDERITRAATYLARHHQPIDCVPILWPFIRLLVRAFEQYKEGLLMLCYLDEQERLFLQRMCRFEHQPTGARDAMHFIGTVHKACVHAVGDTPIDMATHIALSTMLKLQEGYHRLREQQGHRQETFDLDEE